MIASHTCNSPCCSPSEPPPWFPESNIFLFFPFVLNLSVPTPRSSANFPLCHEIIGYSLQIPNPFQLSQCIQQGDIVHTRVMQLHPTPRPCEMMCVFEGELSGCEKVNSTQACCESP